MIKILIALILVATMASASLSVAVSIAPQKWFVEQIMGEGEITILVPTGASPATYAPKPSQLRAIKKATLYFTIGVPFEKNWLKRFQSINPKLKLIDTTKGIQKISMAHADDEHKHKGLDPHVWLSPKRVKIQAKNILDALTKADATQAQIYHDNYNKLIQKIEALDHKIETILDPIKKRKFIVFHPSFGYFANDYNLTQIAIEKEGKEPSLKYIKQLIDYAKAQEIKTLFVAPQFSQKAAKTIASQIKGNVVSIDPLAEDWERNLLEIARSFEKAD
jgi:zinc transport system substrate-binding protein